MRAWLARLALLAASLGLALALAEVVLWVVGYEYRPMLIVPGSSADARVHHLFGDENFVYDPELIWRPKPEFGPFNSLGFRGAELDQKDGKLRVAAVGDSNTLGWSGEDGANWPRELEELLTASAPGVRVINAGVWGYSSHQGVPRTREVLAHEPDLVLISFGSNDGHLVSRSDAEFSRQSQSGRRLALAFKRMRIFQLWTAVSDRPGSEESGLRPRVSQQAYRTNLEAMIADVRDAGAVPVLLTRPYIGPVLNDRRWKHFAPLYNQATAEVAEEQGAMLIDVYSFFKEMDDLFADESHFTERGHELAAAIVFEQLRPWVHAATASK